MEAKMKNIIITVTILSFLNLIGCYYQEQMSPENYSFDENEALKITTKDSVYNINQDDYYLKNDTVFGSVRTKLDAQSTLKTKIKIPVEEMESVEVQRADAVLATFAVLGVLVGVIVAIYIGAAANEEEGL